MKPIQFRILFFAFVTVGLGHATDPHVVLAEDLAASEASPFTKATTKAWRKIGAEVRWFQVSEFGDIDDSVTKKPGDDLPGFLLGPQNRGIEFTKLPKPAKPFALFIDVDWPTFEQMSNLGRFDQLHTLKMWSADSNAKALEGLAKCHSLRALELHLKKINIRHFVQLASLPHLTSMRIFDAKMVTADLAVIASFPKLTRLSLQRNVLPDQAMLVLSSSQSLKHLDVSSAIDDDDLIAAGNLNLKSLDLSCCDVTAVGLESLLSTARIEQLDLSHNRHLNQAACDAIKRLDLEMLDLRSAGLTDSQFHTLWSMKKLRSLDCSGNRGITGYKLDDLSPPKLLEHLDLSDTRLDDDAVKGLGNLKQLRVLNIRNTRITSNGLLKLEIKLPDTKVISSHRE